MTRYEEVKNQTTEEYFRGNQFSIDAFNKKYAAFEGETYVQAVKRVCDTVASVEETEELRKYWGERWFSEIFEDWWHPAGSIMQGAGTGRKVSLCNCTTCTLGTISPNEEWDNLESILRNTAYTVAKCAAYRQGLGVDFSRLRPRGMGVYNSSRESSGAVHWMKLIDSLGYYVGQKGRIPAMLFSLSCNHPDLIEFIKAKSDYNSIQNANVSVQCTESFYDAVEKNLDWEMTFEVPEIKQGQMVYMDAQSATVDCLRDAEGRPFYFATKNRPPERIVRTEKARAILELIARYMFERAEPGIQNIDLARRYSNSDYVYDENDPLDSRIISTNACCVAGETPVLTDKGYVSIHALVGEKVNIWNGLEWSEVEPFVAGYDQKMVKVSLSNGTSLRCTPNHRWRVSRDGVEVSVLVEELKEEDEIWSYAMPVVEGHEEVYEAYTHGFFCGDGQKNGDNGKGALLYGEKKALVGCLAGRTSGEELKGGRIWVGMPAQLADKYEVPVNASVHDKLEWLAGYLDADGVAVHTKNKKSVSLQASSVNHDFLLEVRLLLTTLGVQSHVGVLHECGYAEMPDGRGGKKLYPQQKCYRLSVAGSDVNLLLGLGLNCRRLKLHLNPPTGYGKRKVKVISVEPDGREAVVYCFTEPKNHTGCFNGIITGQSEQYLSRESLCVLASENAGKFSTDPEEFEKQQYKIASSVNRFLDNVNEAELRHNTYATVYQKLAIEKLRRTGAGFTNLAAWLFKQNLEYGSSEAVEATRYFTERFNYHLYRQSIETGREKGSFGLFNREKLEKSPFIKRMMNMGLKFDALRNVTCSSIAPTGTLTLMFREEAMSYGAEPGFGMYYWKRTRISGHYDYYFCVPSIVRQRFAERGFPIPMDSDSLKDTWDGQKGRPVVEFIEKHREEVGIRFKRATEVSPFDKLDMMAAMMESIDSSISITYTLPENTSHKDVYDFILLAHKKGVKSIAAFPDRKMYGIVSYEPFKELALRLTKEGVAIHEQNFTEEELAELGRGRGQEKIIQHDAPKRPKELPCHIYHMTIDKTAFAVVVGLMGESPYEVFAFTNTIGHIAIPIHPGELILPKKHKKGVLRKLRRGDYLLLDETGEKLLEGHYITSMLGGEEEAITRLLSTSLRHGVPLEYLVHQVEKTSGTVVSFSKALARTLKKYIKEGSKVVGEVCPDCKTDSLKRADGCVTCQICGWSRC